MRRPSGINSLRAICRVCWVLKGVASVQESRCEFQEKAEALGASILDPKTAYREGRWAVSV
jgi:hypothetical protein